MSVLLLAVCIAGLLSVVDIPTILVAAALFFLLIN